MLGAYKDTSQKRSYHFQHPRYKCVVNSTHEVVMIHSAQVIIINADMLFLTENTCLRDSRITRAILVMQKIKH